MSCHELRAAIHDYKPHHGVADEDGTHACGFLDAAKLSEDWIRKMQKRALVLEAHHTTQSAPAVPVSRPMA
ncbi:MAG: hypothetical protein WBD87_07445 [Candidatus Acidiferrales bacterium]